MTLSGALYQTKVVNRDGIEGKTYVDEKEGFEVAVSSPMSERKGTNPEQLLGMALATCLKATIEAEETRRKIDHLSQVSVKVELREDTLGYQFVLETEISMPHLSKQEAGSILEVALRRCPMHKLLKGNATYQVHLI
ncbi:OsmC family protein [Facklamia miroungae]|uniref:Organic hydroperoxide reductase OsmC/OhrA n=1 Tax=Facklamia miroungae TaxID=120956 RepID=A0A1G7ST87_9LACT|nr:OsmC family protein [Facklamia miroungae]NKZ29542.1 OsmC family protein [Facklamia miroungae]SDG26346.1 Organic hydroperoxide reductase OsmC/OhrA [Facklamia miroungae]